MNCDSETRRGPFKSWRILVRLGSDRRNLVHLNSVTHRFQKTTQLVYKPVCNTYISWDRTDTWSLLTKGRGSRSCVLVFFIVCCVWKVSRDSSGRWYTVFNHRYRSTSVHRHRDLTVVPHSMLVSVTLVHRYRGSSPVSVSPPPQGTVPRLVWESRDDLEPSVPAHIGTSTPGFGTKGHVMWTWSGVG
jgi:hypothetical protein